MTPGWLESLQHTRLLCPEPIFVIGSPRSGTSALGKALGSHPDAWASNETKFLAYLYGSGRPDQVHRIERDRPTVSWVRTNQVGADEFIAAVGAGFNALLTDRAGGRRWVDHTPDYTAFAGDLARMFPGAQFVHIVRDGRAVVHSMMHFADMFEGERRQQIEPTLPEYFSDFQTACETWSARVDEGSRFAAAHPERCVTVTNESLVSKPDTVMSRILDAVGLEQHPAPARFIEEKRINSSFGRSPGPRVARPWESWPSMSKQTFVELCGARQVELGYDLVD